MKDITSFKELINLTEKNNQRIADVLLDVESFMLNASVDKLKEQMTHHLLAMRESIKSGLISYDKSPSGLSGQDSKKLLKRYSENTNLPFNDLIGKVLSYAITVMEENSRMGKIVACPTAGACGIVPAVLVAYSEEYDFSDEQQIEALVVSAGIGKIVAQSVALAGAVAGCQAECGVGSAMAAGAITCLMGGSNSMIINAAALALKNTLGLACDPVAGLVEVPCVKRNGFYAIHSMTASEMALAGVESVIPIDEIVLAMKQIGALMSPALKESSEGGLAVTETAYSINDRLHKLWDT